MEEYLKYVYHEDLYIMEEPPMLSTEPPASGNTTAAYAHELPPVKFLGANNKKTLVLVNDPVSEFLNSKDLDFLTRIIGALKYSKSDIAIVNCLKFTYDQIFEEIEHEYIVAFGDHPVEHIGIEERYEVSKSNGRKVLLAEELSEIEADRAKKTALWKALQIMFEINQ